MEKCILKFSFPDKYSQKVAFLRKLIIMRVSSSNPHVGSLLQTATCTYKCANISNKEMNHYQVVIFNYKRQN